MDLTNREKVDMYVRDLADSLRRRWYLLVVGIALTLGLSFVAANVVQPTYRTESSVVLVPPKSTTGASGNPYLFLGGLEQSVDVLARALSADNVREAVADTAGAGDYSVVADFATSAPILLITVDDTTSAGAQRLLDAVKAEVPIVFGRLQSSLGVNSRSQITTMVVTSDDEPKAVNKSRYRTVALVAVVSMFLVVVLVGFLDGVLLTRSLRRTRKELEEREELENREELKEREESPDRKELENRKEPTKLEELVDTEVGDSDDELSALERALQTARPGPKRFR